MSQHFRKIKTSWDIANAGKQSQVVQIKVFKMSVMIKNENSRNKTGGSKQDEKKRVFYSILAVTNIFKAEKNFKYGKEKWLEKSSKKFFLETTANMLVTSIPTNNEYLSQS